MARLLGIVRLTYLKFELIVRGGRSARRGALWAHSGGCGPRSRYHAGASQRVARKAWRPQNGRIHAGG